MEKPILFSTAMVQAIWDGRKTQTRRLVKPHRKAIIENIWIDKEDGQVVVVYNDNHHIGEKGYIKPPYAIGDTLWVRETWKKYEKRVGRGNNCHVEEVYGYKADENNPTNPSEFYDGKWHPSIHMPRSAARLFLKVTAIRVEQLRDISELDAFSEGIDEESEGFLQAEHYQSGGVPIQGGSPAVFTFIGLWDSIYKSKGFGWDSNLWVWVIEFEKA